MNLPSYFEWTTGLVYVSFDKVSRWRRPIKAISLLSLSKQSAMKPILIESVLLVSSVILACSTPEPQPAELTGNWTGTFEVAQAGSCTWGGETATTASATWQVTGSSVTATLRRTIGSTTGNVVLNGTRTGSRVVLTHASKNGICNGIGRVYSTQYAGDVAGNTLTLVGYDTICPVQRCIFKQTIRLTQQ